MKYNQNGPYLLYALPFVREVYVYTWDNRGEKAKRVSEFANEGYKVSIPIKK